MISIVADRIWSRASAAHEQLRGLKASFYQNHREWKTNRSCHQGEVICDATNCVYPPKTLTKARQTVTNFTLWGGGGGDPEGDCRPRHSCRLWNSSRATIHNADVVKGWSTEPTHLYCINVPAQIKLPTLVIATVGEIRGLSLTIRIPTLRLISDSTCLSVFFLFLFYFCLFFFFFFFSDVCLAMGGCHDH
jgi:hypothetical protein